LALAVFTVIPFIRLKVAGFTHLFSLMEKGLTPYQAMIVNDFLENNAQQLFQYQDYKLIRVL
jgi:Fe-S cluster assembly scaffold protein SufB